MCGIAADSTVLAHTHFRKPNGGRVVGDWRTLPPDIWGLLHAPFMPCQDSFWEELPTFEECPRRAWCAFEYAPSEITYSAFFDKKDPRVEPKGPPTAYFLFVSDFKRNVFLAPQEMALALSDAWRDLDEESRTRYTTQASEMYAEYERRRSQLRGY